MNGMVCLIGAYITLVGIMFTLIFAGPLYSVLPPWIQMVALMVQIFFGGVLMVFAEWRQYEDKKEGR